MVRLLVGQNISFPLIFWQIFTFTVGKYVDEHDCKELLDKMHVVWVARVISGKDAAKI